MFPDFILSGYFLVYFFFFHSIEQYELKSGWFGFFSSSSYWVWHLSMFSPHFHYCFGEFCCRLRLWHWLEFKYEAYFPLKEAIGQRNLYCLFFLKQWTEIRLKLCSLFSIDWMKWKWLEKALFCYRYPKKISKSMLRCVWVQNKFPFNSLFINVKIPDAHLRMCLESIRFDWASKFRNWSVHRVFTGR